MPDDTKRDALREQVNAAFTDEVLRKLDREASKAHKDLNFSVVDNAWCQVMREGIHAALSQADALPATEQDAEIHVPDLGESDFVADGRRYQLGLRPGSADVHIRKGHMILRCEAEHVVKNMDGAITFGLNGDDIDALVEVLVRSGNLSAPATDGAESHGHDFTFGRGLCNDASVGKCRCGAVEGTEEGSQDCLLSAPATPMCSVCVGEPLPSGKDCICGGVGTERAENQGIRGRLVDLEIALGFFPNVPRQSSKAYDEVMTALSAPATDFKIHTDRLQEVLRLADAEAKDMKHEFVGTHHLLLAVLHESQGIGCAALAQLGFDPERLCDAVREQVRRLTGDVVSAPATDGAESEREHLIDGEFQSDKYPTCPRGKVPLSTKDPMAQSLLWEYAQRRRAKDSVFSGDLEEALRLKGYDGADTKRDARSCLITETIDRIDLSAPEKLRAIRAALSAPATDGEEIEGVGVVPYPTEQAIDAELDRHTDRADTRYSSSAQDAIDAGVRFKDGVVVEPVAWRYRRKREDPRPWEKPFGITCYESSIPPGGDWESQALGVYTEVHPKADRHLPSVSSTDAIRPSGDADLRVALEGHPDSVLEGDAGLVAATMRDVHRLKRIDDADFAVLLRDSLPGSLSIQHDAKWFWEEFATKFRAALAAPPATSEDAALSSWREEVSTIVEKTLSTSGDAALREAAQKENDALMVLLAWIEGNVPEARKRDDVNVFKAIDEAGEALHTALAAPPDAPSNASEEKGDDK